MKEIILPGLIDIHTHCREPGSEQKETFATATKAAIAGGFTAILDMPNNSPRPTIAPWDLEEKARLAKGKIYCDLGFNFGAVPFSIDFFNRVGRQTFGLKLYMNKTTGTLLVDDPYYRDAIFAACPPQKLLMIHGEGDTLAAAISLARKYRRRIHICHVSLAEEVGMIRCAKNEGLSITCEVTPHHLFLTRDDEKALGPFGQMRPPLGTSQDRDALWKGISDGTVDIIASDHAPHTKGEKESENPPAGVPGLETTLPLMLTAVQKGQLGFQRLTELVSTNPRRISNIPTAPGTITVVRIGRKYTIENHWLFTKCGWSPFDGAVVTAQVTEVFLRGEKVFHNGEFRGKPRGKIIQPVA